MKITKNTFDNNAPDKFQIVYRFPIMDDDYCWQIDLGINLFKGISWCLGIGLLFITIEFWLNLNKDEDSNC
jgi:hypothetical protein